MIALNPFIPGRPVQGAEYHGQSRKELSATLADTLKNGRDALVYAPPRHGKTSLLIDVQTRMGKGAVFIDGMQCFAPDSVREYAYAYAGISVPAGQETYPGLGLLSEALRSQGRNLYVMLDEATPIFANFPEAFSAFTKGIGRQENIRFLLGFHTAPYSRLRQKAPEAAGHYATFEVAPFSVEETAGFMAEIAGSHLQFSPEAIGRIHEATGGVPFLLQQIGDQLFAHYCRGNSPKPCLLNGSAVERYARVKQPD